MNLLKKASLFVLTAMVFASCGVEEKESVSGVNWQNIEPFTKKIAPVKEGYNTIILADGDTIFNGNIPLEYLLPKGTTEEIFYSPLSKDAPYYGAMYSGDMVVCFEDTRYGDQDYNDFVVRIRKVNSTSYSWSIADPTGVKVHNNTDWQIQAIACGAGTNLKFGFTIRGNDYILSENVHQDFFNVPVGTFVNTKKNVPMISTINDQSITLMSRNRDTMIYFSDTVNKLYPNIWDAYTAPQCKFSVYYAVPFIINEQGEKLYCAVNVAEVSDNYTLLQGVEGYPLGIATPLNPTANALLKPTAQFKYPYEMIDISEAYSSYENWISGSVTTLGAPTDTSKCVTNPGYASSLQLQMNAYH
ncbi:MAG: LruC domain-containing protein [Bacteroidales bacterium]|nr:LruC domain-containing protein [Bacteroidales bacterium]